MQSNGDVFVLNMGKPIKIYDIAVKVLKSLNLEPYNNEKKSGQVKVNFIGLKKGEKLNEELYHEEYLEKSNNQLIKKEKVILKKENQKYMLDLENLFNNLNNYNDNEFKNELLKFL